MRIENSQYVECFGSVRINRTQRVLELDSGRKATFPDEESTGVCKLEEEVLQDIERRMCIVLLMKNEGIKLLEGVIRGVPHDCLIVVISDTAKYRANAVPMELDMLREFCRLTQRQALFIHQKDPLFARALKEGGYAELLGEDKLVRDGKGEGMMMGILMNMIYKKDYVGFIDVDNYIPGSVWEYVKSYAAGFSLANSPFAMVRVLWGCKSTSELCFRRWGRVSRFSNRYLNLLLAKTGLETDIIKTANAGEHAMSMELAPWLWYASGYAMETQELVSILEQFGGILPTKNPTIAEHGVDIFQIETINPHIHEERGEEHLINEILLPSLSTTYHSQLCEPRTKQLILDELRAQGYLEEGKELPKPHLYPPLQKVNMPRFQQFIHEPLPDYLVLGEPVLHAFL